MINGHPRWTSNWDFFFWPQWWSLTSYRSIHLMAKIVHWSNRSNVSKEVENEDGLGGFPTVAIFSQFRLLWKQSFDSMVSLFLKCVTAPICDVACVQPSSGWLLVIAVRISRFLCNKRHHSGVNWGKIEVSLHFVSAEENWFLNELQHKPTPKT